MNINITFEVYLSLLILNSFYPNGMFSLKRDTVSLMDNFYGAEMIKVINRIKKKSTFDVITLHNAEKY